MCRRLVLFRSTAGVTTTQLEQAASQLETYLNQRFVHALVRQQDSQPDEVAVLVANKSKLDKAVKVLTDEGYESGPPTGPELTLSEGQPLTVRFRGNISEAEGRSVSYVKEVIKFESVYPHVFLSPTVLRINDSFCRKKNTFSTSRVFNAR